MKEEHIASEHLQLKWVTKSDNKRVISFIKEYELLKGGNIEQGKMKVTSHTYSQKDRKSLPVHLLLGFSSTIRKVST